MANGKRHLLEDGAEWVDRRHEQLVVTLIKGEHAGFDCQVAGNELEGVRLELVEVAIVDERKTKALVEQVEEGVLIDELAFEQGFDERLADAAAFIFASARASSVRSRREISSCSRLYLGSDT